jgi:hypothetical protein
MRRIDESIGDSGPHWTPVPADDGDGLPHPPVGGRFNVAERDLIAAARCWDRVAEHLRAAKVKCEEGWGQPGLFGFADSLWTVGRMHETFNERVCYATHDGSLVTAQVADGLVGTANVAAGTDADQSDNFDALRRAMLHD